MDITFNCGKCGQSITIDEAGAGQLVDCPKCGKPMEVPYKSAAAVPQAPSVPPQPERLTVLAQKVQGYSTSEGGMEGTLEDFCRVILWLSVISAACLVFAFINEQRAVFVMAAVASIIQGIFFYIVFRAGAEVIRLLKKLAGLPFSGEISKPWEIYHCSECQQSIDNYQSSCPKCGAKFQDARR